MRFCDQKSQKISSYINFKKPLHLATIKGHLEMCKMIINRITDINPIDDDKWSPLGIAYEHRHQELFKFIAAKIKEKV